MKGDRGHDLILAKSYTPAQRGPATGGVDYLVIHTTENPTAPGVARNVATWFAGPDAPKASAHYVIDPSEIVQSVPERSIAWGAQGANSKGIHLEHAGFAHYTAAEWASAPRPAMLARSAELARGILNDWNIPVVYIGAEGFKNGARGIVTHADIVKATGQGTHWDPGPAWPMSDYIAMIEGGGSDGAMAIGEKLVVAGGLAAAAWWGFKLWGRA